MPFEIMINENLSDKEKILYSLIFSIIFIFTLMEKFTKKEI